MLKLFTASDESDEDSDDESEFENMPIRHDYSSNNESDSE